LIDVHPFFAILQEISKNMLRHLLCLLLSRHEP
jgi:hypothetical protein